MWGRPKEDTEIKTEEEVARSKFNKHLEAMSVDDRLAFIQRFNAATPEELRTALDNAKQSRQLDDRDACDQCNTARAIQEGFSILVERMEQCNSIIEEALTVVDPEDGIRKSALGGIANAIERTYLQQAKVTGLDVLRKELRDVMAKEFADVRSAIKIISRDTPSVERLASLERVVAPIRDGLAEVRGLFEQTEEKPGEIIPPELAQSRWNDLVKEGCRVRLVVESEPAKLTAPKRTVGGK